MKVNKDDIVQLGYIEKFLRDNNAWHHAVTIGRVKGFLECLEKQDEKERREEFLYLNGMGGTQSRD